MAFTSGPPSPQIEVCVRELQGFNGLLQLAVEGNLTEDSIKAAGTLQEEAKRLGKIRVSWLIAFLHCCTADSHVINLFVEMFDAISSEPCSRTQQHLVWL